ncbi:GNAT family N-acetyltransferase [Kribbella solani]|uniref:GNAT family N-acetyltransferase n=1 Tax=Kribbella solani TaxID=236067 RepID=UPI0029A2DB4E|nr:GNAT family N-acetyltransferase [Kribbella solani]MDX3005246.1 GNAT family N-acetyltransferase [Kribbella solani]
MYLRPATAADLPFLIEMMLEACNWDGTPWFDEAKVRSEDQVWRYLDGWPRDGDFGVIAELGGSPAGATWGRLLTRNRAGYGYIADDVPELTLGVSPAFRRRGVARAVLTELVAQARAAAYTRLSLSVDPGNPARTLYESLGFRKVGVVGTSDTMLLEL